MEEAVEKAKSDLKVHLRQLIINSISSSSGAGSVYASSGRYHYSHPRGDTLLYTGTTQQPARLNDESVARYLREKGYEYSLSVFVAEGRLDPGNSYAGPSTNPHPNPPTNPTTQLAHEADDHHQEQIAKKNRIDLRSIAQQLWHRLDRKYRWKMKMHRGRRKAELRRRVAELEKRFAELLTRREHELNAKYERKLDVLYQREQEMLKTFSLQKSVEEKRVLSQRQEVLAQIRELEHRRIQLQDLEEEFARHCEAERARMRNDREHVSEREMVLKRAELRVEARVEEAAATARDNAQRALHERATELANRERAYQEVIKKTEDKLKELQRIKLTAHEKSDRIKELEAETGCQKQEIAVLEKVNENLKSKLRPLADYDRVKRDNDRLRAELQLLQKDDVGFQARVQLEAEMERMRTKVELAEKTLLLKDEEWKLKFEQERSEYRNLVSHFKMQADETKELARELARLKKFGMPVSEVKRTVKKKAIATRFEKSPSSSKSETEVSSEATPNFVLDARHRLKQLEIESENLDASLKSYMQLKQSRQSNNLSNQTKRNSRETLSPFSHQETSEDHTISLRHKPLLESTRIDLARDDKAMQRENSEEEKERKKNEQEERQRKNNWKGSNQRNEVQEERKEKQRKEEVNIERERQRKEQVNIERDSQRKEEVNNIERQRKEQLNVETQKKEKTVETKDGDGLKSKAESPASNVEEGGWEERLKKREEERRKQEEQRRRMEEQELKRIQEEEEKAVTHNEDEQQEAEVSAKNGEEATSAPPIDPLMQQYMKMIMEQRQNEKDNPPPAQPSAALQRRSEENRDNETVQDPNIETGPISPINVVDDDFW